MALLMTTGCGPKAEFFIADEEGLPLQAQVLRWQEHVPVVRGVPEGAEVEIEIAEGKGRSSARFIVNYLEAVHLGYHAPVAGSWQGEDGTAWIWSLDPQTNRPFGPSTARIRLKINGELQSELLLKRTDIPPGVTMREVAEDEVIGTLVVPEGQGPFPGVVVFHGSEGNTKGATRRCLELSAEGILCFAPRYFGDPLPQASILEIPLERIEAQLDWFLARAELDSSRPLVAIGSSRGGEVALMAAARVEQIAGVVTLVGSAHRWAAMNDALSPAWTEQGKPLPVIAKGDVPLPQLTEEDGRQVLRTTPFLRQVFDAASDQQRQAALIPLDTQRVKLLMIGAEDDQLWPSCDLAQAAAAAYGAENVEYHCLAGAGHSLTVPGHSTMGASELDLDGGAVQLLGGDPASHAKAQYEASAMLKAFVKAVHGVDTTL